MEENLIKSEGKQKEQSKKKKTAAHYAIEFFIKIGVTALIIVILLIFVCGIYINHSNSSYPMLKDGDLCLTYKPADLSEGMEIAYIRDDRIRFGRIVASEGDIVDISDGQITVNGYNVFEDTVYPTTSEGSKIEYPYQVPEGTYFVLNDYRDDPDDSRCFGGISKKDTRGKVIMLLRRRGI